MHKGPIHQETELLRISDRHAGDLTYREKRQHSRLQVWARSWRLVVFLSFLASLIVLLLNLGFLIWVAASNSVQNSRGVLFEGNCDKVQRLNVGIHFLVNVLATVLLGASNYTMVCLFPRYYTCRPADPAAMPVGSDQMRRKSGTPQWPLAGHRRAQYSQSGAYLRHALSSVDLPGFYDASFSSPVRLGIFSPVERC